MTRTLAIAVLAPLAWWWMAAAGALCALAARDGWLGSGVEPWLRYLPTLQMLGAGAAVALAARVRPGLVGAIGACIAAIGFAVAPLGAAGPIVAAFGAGLALPAIYAVFGGLFGPGREAARLVPVLVTVAATMAAEPSARAITWLLRYELANLSPLSVVAPVGVAGSLVAAAAIGRDRAGVSEEPNPRLVGAIVAAGVIVAIAQAYAARLAAPYAGAHDALAWVPWVAVVTTFTLAIGAAAGTQIIGLRAPYLLGAGAGALLTAIAIGVEAAVRTPGGAAVGAALLGMGTLLSSAGVLAALSRGRLAIAPLAACLGAAPVLAKAALERLPSSLGSGPAPAGFLGLACAVTGIALAVASIAWERPFDLEVARLEAARDGSG